MKNRKKIFFFVSQVKYDTLLKFWIIKKDLSQIRERLTLENIIIHLFLQREIPILNAIEPSIYKITNFNLG